MKIEKLLVGGLKVYQSESGYRHAIDPYLLSSFCKIRRGDVVIDLGSASGIIPLLLAGMSEAEKLIGVEIQERLADLARRNIDLNGLHGRIEIINADIREITAGGCLDRESCDVVVSNPPYRSVGTGKLAPGFERAACRHELHGGIRDFISAACYLLRNKGRFCLVYLPERLPELLALLCQAKIEPKRLRMVHSREGGEAVLVLIEGRKGGRPGLTVEAPLCIYDNEIYSGEVRKLFGI